VVVSVDEFDHLGQYFAVAASSRQGGADCAQEQRSRRPIAVVALVPHMQGLRDQCLDVDPGRHGLQRPVQYRI